MLNKLPEKASQESLGMLNNHCGSRLNRLAEIRKSDNWRQLPTIVTDKKFSDIPAYPNIARDYAYTLDAMKKLSFDIWLASHASQFELQRKHKPGTDYNPGAFIDKKGYDEEIRDLQDRFLKKVKEK